MALGANEEIRTERLDMARVAVERSPQFRQVYATAASLTGLPNEIVIVFGGSSINLQNPSQPILIQEVGVTMSYAHAEALASRLQAIVDQHNTGNRGGNIVVPSFSPPRGGGSIV